MSKKVVSFLLVALLALSIGASTVSVASASECECTCVTYTQGYWKNHPEAWPVCSLTLGSETYSKTQLLSILDEPVKGNGLVSLAHQLIAAKLNKANGSCVPDEVCCAIKKADALIDGKVIPPIGDGYLAPSTTSCLVEKLTAYNE